MQEKSLFYHEDVQILFKSGSSLHADASLFPAADNKWI